MSDNVESLLKQAELRYVKEVEPGGEEERYSLPFETPDGTIFVGLYVGDILLSPNVFIRTLDSIGVGTSKSQFLADLLKLNKNMLFARVSIWQSPDEDVEWLVTEADLPTDSITPENLRWVVEETVSLTQKVLETISAHSTATRKQLV